MDRSYDDRTLFWPLEYRGELRKKVLAYGRSRGLLQPEDCGTMTHWYSRTPESFLEHYNPDFVPQSNNNYKERSGLVWDIRQEQNMENYFALTEAHIQNYGDGQIFHTIGLAERRCYADREKNHQLKLYTYRRIINKLREKYPHAPLLIASWDFVSTWTHDEVKSLIFTGRQTTSETGGLWENSRGSMAYFMRLKPQRRSGVCTTILPIVSP